MDVSTTVADANNAKKKMKKKSMFKSEYTLFDAVIKGGWTTKLSMVVMGFGNIAHKRVIKGLIFLLLEATFIFYMVVIGAGALAGLPSLGDQAQVEVWNEDAGVYEYQTGDNSLLYLLYGVATIVFIVIFFCFWAEAVRSAYKAECLSKRGGHLNTFREDLRSLLNENLWKFLMFFPFAGILLFTILPLVFMIPMAFTNYSTIGDHLVLFDWVGMENFKTILGLGGSLGKEFWSVLGWTLVWAFFATFLNFFFGMILAIVIQRKDTKLKAFWRTIFVISIAVPQFVSLLIMRTMLNRNGVINNLLMDWGWIQQPLPFWEDATWARVSVIVINCWIGIPYSMLQVTGILQNIPGELTEAAKIDGANSVQVFFKITLPYVLFIMGPDIITQFTGNINNFNVIYLLSGGAPVPVGATAGKTDLLVTWLYKLTIDYQYYNLGAVIGIITFIVLSIVALITYRNTAAYKDEEGFQ